MRELVDAALNGDDGIGRSRARRLCGAPDGGHADLRAIVAFHGTVPNHANHARAVCSPTQHGPHDLLDDGARSSAEPSAGVVEFGPAFAGLPLLTQRMVRLAIFFLVHST